MVDLSGYWSADDQRWQRWGPVWSGDSISEGGSAGHPYYSIIAGLDNLENWESVAAPLKYVGAIWTEKWVDLGGEAGMSSVRDFSDQFKSWVNTKKSEGFAWTVKFDTIENYNMVWSFVHRPSGSILLNRIVKDNTVESFFTQFVLPVFGIAGGFAFLGQQAAAVTGLQPQTAASIIRTTVNVAAGGDIERSLIGTIAPAVFADYGPTTILSPPELGTIEPDLLALPTLPVFEPEVLTPLEVLPVFEPELLAPLELLPVFETELLPVFETKIEPVAFNGATMNEIEETPWWVKLLNKWQLELDQAALDKAALSIAPVVELPAIETMAPIPTIDVAPPTIEPIEVFTQPVEVPQMNDFFWNESKVETPEFDVDFLEQFEGGSLIEPWLDDVSIPEAVLTYAVLPYGDDIYGPPVPGETYPPAYDVVTVDDAAQLPADILVGGGGGGVVEVGGNFAPNPNPANPNLSVGQVLRDANGIMLEALKLVDSYRRLINPQPPNRVAQARVGSSTVRATPDGMIVTTDASGRTVRTKPPVGQPQMTTDGSMIVNNGDGTYTSIAQSGAMATNRYPTTGAAAAPSNYTTPLLIGGAILALVALTR
jgi:hypothetical protein